MDRYDTCAICGGVLRPMDPAPAGTYACECGDRYDAWKAERDAEEGEQQMEKEAPMIVRGSATPDTLHQQIEAAYDAAQIESEPRSGLRRRVHIAISTKGQRTWDTTVEGTGYSEDEILAASDSLVREMETRYPAAGD
jgi:hypothetical protein